MTTVEEDDVVEYRYSNRLRGKQPAHRLHQPGRRPGGEEVNAAMRKLRKC